MDWQLPDIGKTITNNSLPSSLSAYAVRIGRYSHRAFPNRVALFPWFVYSRKIRFNSMHHVGHVLND